MAERPSARHGGAARADPSGPLYKPLLVLIVKRVTIFFLVIFLTSFFFWAVGSYRSFLEETQLMLLGALKRSSLGLALASGAGFAVSIVYLFARPRAAAMVGLFGYAAVAALGIAGLALSAGLAALSRGIG